MTHSVCVARGLPFCLGLLAQGTHQPRPSARSSVTHAFASSIFLFHDSHLCSVFPCRRVQVCGREEVYPGAGPEGAPAGFHPGMQRGWHLQSGYRLRLSHGEGQRWGPELEGGDSQGRSGKPPFTQRSVSPPHQSHLHEQACVNSFLGQKFVSLPPGHLNYRVVGTGQLPQ